MTGGYLLVNIPHRSSPTHGLPDLRHRLVLIDVPDPPSTASEHELVVLRGSNEVKEDITDHEICHVYGTSVRTRIYAERNCKELGRSLSV